MTPTEFRTQAKVIRARFIAKSVIELSDWAELSTFSITNGEFSFSDLERCLQREVSKPSEAENQRIADSLIQVSREIERRQRTGGASYPFVFDSQTRVLKLVSRDAKAYLFCLMLSHINAGEGVGRLFPARVFEEVCTLVSRVTYGNAFRFGFPRQGVEPKEFKQALLKLGGLLGKDIEHSIDAAGNDRKLDIVGIAEYLNVHDGIPNNLVLFGQCATGSYSEKIRELDPDGFCRTWLRGVVTCPVIKVFFFPSTVYRGLFNDMTSSGVALIFDRFRISKAFSTYGTDSVWAEVDTLNGLFYAGI
jgi:hypothetical protein